MMGQKCRKEAIVFLFEEIDSTHVYVEFLPQCRQSSRTRCELPGGFPTPVHSYTTKHCCDLARCGANLRLWVTVAQYAAQIPALAQDCDNDQIKIADHAYSATCDFFIVVESPGFSLFIVFVCVPCASVCRTVGSLGFSLLSFRFGLRLHVTAALRRYRHLQVNC